MAVEIVGDAPDFTLPLTGNYPTYRPLTGSGHAINQSIIVLTSPPPTMGEGWGGGGQDENPLVPPPLHPLPPRGGAIFFGSCLFNYGLLNNSDCFVNQYSVPRSPLQKLEETLQDR